MRHQDRPRHEQLIRFADLCEARAEQAIQDGSALGAHTWLGAMHESLAAARLLEQPVGTPDLYEMLRDALPSVLLPASHTHDVDELVGEDETVFEVDIGLGKAHYYRAAGRISWRTFGPVVPYRFRPIIGCRPS